MIAEHILKFYSDLKIPPLPKSIIAMNPYQNRDTLLLCEQFYNKYYADSDRRILMLGINPGRFGSGITGISFTDPIRLEDNCRIKNTLAKKPELSATFIYSMIEAYGGTAKFYKKYFISAVSPLGFLKNNKNANYYDDSRLQTAVTPFIVNSIERIISTVCEKNICYCIGEGENFKFLSGLNVKHGWFKKLVPLPHPRFIMQYRRKRLLEYVELYLNVLAE